MVSFLWINRYHFLARWHKPNTYQHIFYPMSSLLLFVLKYIYAYDEIMYAEMIQWLSSIDIWRVSFYLLFIFVFISMITVVDALGLGCAVKRSKYRQQQKMVSYYSVVVHNDVTFGFRTRVQFLPIINRVMSNLYSFSPTN